MYQPNLIQFVARQFFWFWGGFHQKPVFWEDFGEYFGLWKERETVMWQR